MHVTTFLDSISSWRMSTFDLFYSKYNIYLYNKICHSYSRTLWFVETYSIDCSNFLHLGFNSLFFCCRIPDTWERKCFLCNRHHRSRGQVYCAQASRSWQTEIPTPEREGKTKEYNNIDNNYYCATFYRVFVYVCIPVINWTGTSYQQWAASSWC